MCKVMIIPRVPKGKSDLALKFIKASVKFMTASDPHGIGYAAISDNKLSGECWINPNDAFQSKEITELDSKLHSLLGDSISKTNSDYRSFGDVNLSSIQSIMLHSRYATCDKSIENTHPFHAENTALIHNGVISNASQLTNKTSTCDSEVILNEYIAKNVRIYPKRIVDVIKALRGWYTVAVMTQIDDQWYIDVFKETQSTLIAAYIKELDSTVFCTSESILKATAKACKFTLSHVHTIRSGLLIRIECRTGESILHVPFESAPREFMTESTTAWDYLRTANDNNTNTDNDDNYMNDDEDLSDDESARIDLMMEEYYNRHTKRGSK